MKDLPVILEDASNVIFSKSLCNRFTLILGKGNAGMVIIDANTTIKVACICTPR